jgi:hypothetical protein
MVESARADTAQTTALTALWGGLSGHSTAGQLPSLKRLDGDALRRSELAAFLRSRRERILPSVVGVPAGGRRRTPGLRREEVAQLAGVGVTWYTWLEQGRDIKVSDRVLEAIARTLLLDRAERSHLFTLAGSAAVVAGNELAELPAGIQVLMDKLAPFPAMIQTASYDIIAYNATYGRLIDDLDAKPVEDRNSMLLLFTDPAWRAAFPNWDTDAARMVAQFRAGMAEHVADPAWKAQLRRLRLASHEFAALWDRHEVRAMQNKGTSFRNPQVGVLRFDVTNIWLQPRTAARMRVYIPADSESRDRLDKLAEWIATERRT